MSNDTHNLLLDPSKVSEAELRELFENAEIERFLQLFEANVTEVRSTETLSSLNGRKLGSQHIPREDAADGFASDTPDIGPSSDSPPTSRANCSLLGGIIDVHLVPRLPSPRLPPAQFTIRRLRLATQRLYLAVESVYVPFLSRMVDLATWEDRTSSCLYCIIFWTLWYHNMLLPCFFLRIFYSLLRRKLLSYPTLSELRDHQREVSSAAEFGEQLSGRLSASSSFGFKEMWRLFKIINKTPRNKFKVTATATDYPSGEPASGIQAQPSDATGLDDAKDSQDAQDLKRLGVHAINEIADLHERIKNMFTWRRPESSYVYGIAIFCLFLVTLLLPAKYLSKLAYFACGVFFWHITPIFAAMSPADRLRLPPAFGDVPTDADYAMELIAKRVTAGQDVQPLRVKWDGTTYTCARVNTTTHDPTAPRGSEEQEESKSHSVDWKKWGERVARSKAWAGDGKRFVSGIKPGEIVSQQSQSLPVAPAVEMARPEQIGESHTYPAQHASGPGLITLTSTELLFTPLMSSEPKVIIPVKTIRGIKKAGLVKGLQLHFVNGALEDAESGEREERFRWVGSRDDLFARLVGFGGSKWKSG